MSLSWGTVVGSAASLGGSVVAFFRVKEWWDARRERNEKKIREQAKHDYEAELTESFIFEIATNHLPHLYDALKLIAERFDVHLPDPPPIKYLPFDPSERKK